MAANTTSRRTAVRLLGVAAALLLLVGAPAVAAEKEEPTRTVKGMVTDEAEAPLKAVVQIKNLRSLDVKSYHTGVDGRFYFYGLDPNIDYEVKGLVKGYRPKTRKVSSFDDRMELFYAMRLKKE